MFVTLCTGLLRSASTWSFNVCREINQHIADQQGCKLISGYRDGARLDAFLKAKIDDPGLRAVVKSHFPGQFALELIRTGRALNVCTLRDPRDCFLSLHRYGELRFDEVLAQIKRNLELVTRYAEFGNAHFIPFERLLESPIDEILRLAKWMGTVLVPEAVTRIHEETSLQRARALAERLEHAEEGSVHRVRSHRVDNRTLIHQFHINRAATGEWIYELSAAEQRRLNGELRQWLIALHYETAQSIAHWS
jgi:hypothetical protein